MRAISSMATRHLLAELLGLAAESGLPPVALESMGGVDAARRVSDGERVDLVFLAEDALRTLAGSGSVDAATVAPFARSQVAVAVAVASGSDDTAAVHTDPAFPDAAGVRAAIRAATRIGYSTGPSGTALLRMIDDGGLAGEVGGRLLQARPGVPVARLLADGEADLGFQQLSELVGQPGVRILGVLPEDCAIETVFSGAVAVSSDDPAHAADVLRMICSAQAAPVIRAHSFGAP